MSTVAASAVEVKTPAVFAPEAEAHDLALSLRKLLGRTTWGAFQEPDGNYRRRLAIDVRDLTLHFRGVSTIAIEIVQRGRSRCLGFDLDKRGAARMACIGIELGRRGLAGGSICTSGSDPDRRKVLVFFAKPKSQAVLHALGREIVDAASKHTEWGIAPTNSVSIYPMLGEGGLLRFGGFNRSPYRQAVGVDAWFSIHGEPRHLDQVVPVKRLHGGMIEKAPQQAWVQNEIDDPWTYEGGSNRVIKRLVRLAGEAYRLAGDAQGPGLFREWTEAIYAASPAMQAPSPSGDERAERTWARKVGAAWKYAVTKAREAAGDPFEDVFADATLSSPERPLRGLDNVASKKPRTSGKARVIELLKSWTLDKGVTRDTVAISYRTIGNHLGIDPMTAHRHVAALVQDGLLVIHDRGTKGVRGLPTIVGLVAIGSNPAETLALGKTRGNMKIRTKRKADFKAACDAGLVTPNKTIRHEGVPHLDDRRKAKLARIEAPEMSQGDGLTAVNDGAAHIPSHKHQRAKDEPAARSRSTALSNALRNPERSRLPNAPQNASQL